MSAPVTHPAFAHHLPPREPTFRELVERAVATSEAMSAICGAGDAITDHEWNRADEAAFDARRALFDHLLNEHGITRSLAVKMGGVLL